MIDGAMNSAVMHGIMAGGDGNSSGNGNKARRGGTGGSRKRRNTMNASRRRPLHALAGMDWMLREQGGRDWRLLPAALTMRASSLAAHLAFERWMAVGQSAGDDAVAGGPGLSVGTGDIDSGTVDVAGGAAQVGASPVSDAVEESFVHLSSYIGAIAPVVVLAIALALIWFGFRRKIRWTGTVAVCLALACVGGITAIVSDTVAWHDPASAWAREQGAYTRVWGTVVAPVVASDQRAYDCQVDVRFHGIIAADEAERGMQRSAADVRLYAGRRYCAKLHRGASYRLGGTLQVAEYGGMPLWLLVEGGDAVVEVSGPPLHRAAVEHMQQAFFQVTERLSDQGRILVPGLTMGVLGQDYVDLVTVTSDDDTGSSDGTAYDDTAQDDTVRDNSATDGAVQNGTVRDDSTPDDAAHNDSARSDSPAPLNDTYANTLEDRFRHSGIMHLMAVSGGHFVLLADMIRRLCKRWLIPRYISAGLIAFAYVVLALVVFPGDSVTRALVMGLMGAAAHAIGRRTQPLSALCWTVIGALTLDPDMSRSYGFALSSAAVLGIVLFAGPLGEALGRVLPEAMAQMVAMTVGAQLFTLPIQILMEPELPLLSVPANLLVSPFVGFATITGLMSLACAWCLPWLAGALAWAASLGTLVMERVAMWLGGGAWAVMPWPDGVLGAMLMLLTELCLAIFAIAIIRCMRRLRAPESGLSGRRFGSARRVRFALWWQETRNLLHPSSKD